MLQLLETFCAVADLGSLTKAAEHLFISQPAVTRQLRTLERELGAVLLTRSPRGITLTPAGEAVLPHARAAVAAARACRQVAREFSATAATRLRVSAGLMATLYVLPAVVATFRARHPEVEVDLQPTSQQLALERLLTYQVDVAVIATPVRSAQVRATAILEDPLQLVAAPRGAQTPVRLEDLEGDTLLVLASGTGLHEQVETALRERGVSAHLVEYPTAETIKSAVALGMGTSILPASAVHAELVAGTLEARPLAGWPGARRLIRALVRAEGRPPSAAAEFVALLQAHYASQRRAIYQKARGPSSA